MAHRATLEKVVDQKETDFYITANHNLRDAIELKEMARELRKHFEPKELPGTLRGTRVPRAQLKE